MMLPPPFEIATVHLPGSVGIVVRYGEISDDTDGVATLVGVSDSGAFG